MSDRVSSYRFARRPRWVVLHLLVIVFVPVFALAGLWQLRRLDERRASNALVRDRQAMQPVTSLDGDVRFRRADLEGRYARPEIILAGRPLDGRPGHHVLAPFETRDGDTLIVDRGWIPADATPGDAPAPRATARLEGILLPSEERAPFTKGPGNSDRITRIDLDSLSSRFGDDLEPVYLLLQDQTPSQSRDLPAPARLAELGEGSHLSYAVQWFLFIPTLLVIYVLVLRKQARRRSPA